MKVVIKKSTKAEKKYMAIFYDGKRRVNTTHFGAAGMSDYTKHKDAKTQTATMNRHRTRENWSNYMMPVHWVAGYSGTNQVCILPFVITNNDFPSTKYIILCDE